MFTVAGNHDYTSHGSGNVGICLVAGNHDYTSHGNGNVGICLLFTVKKYPARMI